MPTQVLRHQLGGGFSATAVYRALFGDATDAFWLDSGADGTSYLGVGEPVELPPAGGVLDALRTELAREALVADDGAPAFRLGLVGWLGYELRAETMGVDVARTSRYPVAAFLLVTRAVAITAAGEASLLALGDSWDGELASWRDVTVAALSEVSLSALEVTLEDPLEGRTRHLSVWRDTRAEYLAKVAACQDAIREGEAYQLCLTSEVEVAGDFDPLDTYLRLRSASPTHHGALVRIGDVSLLSSSPERFLEVDPVGTDRMVRTHPIKGTRPRSLDPVLDAQLSEQLLGSEKERAENVMIVDLMRNDLARVSETGSVSVPSLLDVESYAQVHQLVSTVQGQLRAGLTGIDAIAACFPAGSMTGAPKQRATEILDRLEGRARGIYAGAFGYLGFDGRVDLAMTIRTIVLDEGGATIGAGGGITALSVPEEEWDEARLKAAALLRALGIATLE